MEFLSYGNIGSVSHDPVLEKEPKVQGDLERPLLK